MRKAALGTIGAVAMLAVAVIVAGVLTLRPVPALSLTTSVVTSASQPGSPQIAWPQAREAAATVDGIDRTWSSGGQAEVPIASVTKVMTAYVVLRDHPLGRDEQGPLIPVTKADVKEYKSALKAGDSVAKVAANQPLTEREALEALMLPSADNIAWMLAVWDAGSTGQFAGKMNAVARSLGLHRTVYTDPSGLAPSTVSTALDQLTLMRSAMRVPVFAQIVAMPYAVIPAAGVIRNYNPAAGTDGIIGVKTGTDSQAGGCWAFAVKREVGGAGHVVYGVVLGTALGNPSLASIAVNAGLHLAGAMQKTVRYLTVLPAGATVGQINVPWSKTPVSVVTARPLSGWALSGAHITLDPKASLPGSAASSTVPAGTTIGEISASGLRKPVIVPLVTASGVRKPTLTWRLFR